MQQGPGGRLSGFEPSIARATRLPVAAVQCRRCSLGSAVRVAVGSAGPSRRVARVPQALSRKRGGRRVSGLRPARAARESGARGGKPGVRGVGVSLRVRFPALRAFFAVPEKPWLGRSRPLEEAARAARPPCRAPCGVQRRLGPGRLPEPFLKPGGGGAFGAPPASRIRAATAPAVAGRWSPRRGCSESSCPAVCCVLRPLRVEALQGQSRGPARLGSAAQHPASPSGQPRSPEKPDAQCTKMAVLSCGPLSPSGAATCQRAQSSPGVAIPVGRVLRSAGRGYPTF